MQTRTHATLLTLQKGRTNLAGLASAIRRAGHVSGQPGQFFAKGKDGETFFGFIGRGRYFEVLVDGAFR